METTANVVIDRDPETVFAFVADAENNPRWQRGMRSCKWTTDAPIGVGSVYAQEARFLGRPVISTFEVTDFQPGRSITITTIESTFPITVTRRVEPRNDGGAWVSATVRGEPSGIFRLFGPLLRPMLERSVAKDYERLKRTLESGD